MKNAGRSVLWFLGACLIFTDATIAVVARSGEGLHGAWILVFGVLSLAAILGALLFMFKQSPAFLVAEHGDLAPLTLIQGILRSHSPHLAKLLIERIPTAAWSGGTVDEPAEPSEEDEDLPPDEEVDDDTNLDPGEESDFRDMLQSLVG